MLGVSVVLCCYNSAKRLPKTLEHIARQKVKDSIKWEVVLVDNNSNDSTAQSARNLWKELSNKLDFRIINESKPGLSYARRAGLKASLYDYVLFCDDDNWLNDDYLINGFSILQSNPKIGMLGGIGKANVEFPKPKWFAKHQIMFAVGPQHKDYPDLTNSKCYTYGAGTFIRKQPLLKIVDAGVEPLLSDRVGKALVSSGDNEIGYWFKAAGFQIHWSKNLCFAHDIPNTRLNVTYIKKLHIGYTQTFEIVNSYRSILLDGKERNGVSLRKDFILAFKRSLYYYLFESTRGEDHISNSLKLIFNYNRALLIFKKYFFYKKIQKKVALNVYKVQELFQNRDAVKVS